MAQSLPAKERALYYRALSADSLQRAVATQDQRLREAYVSLAMGWARMAEMCEKSDSLPTLPVEAANTEAPDLSLAAVKPPPDPESKI